MYVIMYAGLSTHRRSALIVAEGVVIIVIAIRICLTLVEFVQYPTKSLKSLQNWIKLVIFTCSIIHVSVFNTLCHCPTGWQWQIGTVAVLFVWFDLIIFIRKLQLFDIGTYFWSQNNCKVYSYNYYRRSTVGNII